jgi:hypothetical protein
MSVISGAKHPLTYHAKHSQRLPFGFFGIGLQSGGGFFVTLNADRRRTGN